MAFPRTTLKAMGLSEEQIQTIVDMHMETVEGLKAERDKYKEEAKELPEVKGKLKKAEEALETVKNDGWKEKHDALKTEFDKFKSEMSAKETHAAKEKAFRELLKSLNVSEKRIDSIIKVTDFDKIELDGDKLKDAETHSNNIKTEWADFIVSTQIEGAKTHNPPANMDGKPLTKADLYKKDERGRYVMSTAERQKALAENPNIN